MKIDRDMFSRYILNDHAPQWPCPTCEHGILRMKKESLQLGETKASRQLHMHDAWEPDWIDEIFCCLLYCSDSSCGEVVSVSGKTKNEIYTSVDENGEHVESRYRSLIPMTFCPEIDLFKISTKVPLEISNIIKSAFNLFWADSSSCANKIRVCVEIILTHFKVKYWTINKARKKVPIALHHRIVEFQKKQPEIAKSLFAIKWIGNAGSHSGSLTRSDLYDGFDILKYLIDEMFDHRTKSIADLGKRINKIKGPLSKVKAAV